MKTFSHYCVVLFLLCGGICLVSCQKSNETTATPPTIELAAEMGFVHADTSMYIHSTFKVKLLAFKGSSDLLEVSVLRDGILLPIDRMVIQGSNPTHNPIPTTVFDRCAFMWEIELHTYSVAGVFTYRFQVTAEDGLHDYVELNINAIDPGPPPSPPTIIFGTGPGYLSSNTSVLVNSSFKINIHANKGSSDLAILSIYKDGMLLDPDKLRINNSPVANNPIEIGFADTTVLDWEIEIVAADFEVAHTYSFEIEAGDGLTNSVLLVITTYVPVDVDQGVLFNAAGPVTTGGLDLDTGMGVSFNTAAADIRDLGIDIGQPIATNWRQQIAPANNAELRAAPAATTWAEIATKEAIQAGFNASGANLNMTNKLNGGELFFVRRDGKYYFIRIAKVNVTTNDNNDNYEIDIKR